MKTSCPFCGSHHFMYLVNVRSVTIIRAQCKRRVGRTLNYKPFLIKNNKKEDDSPLE
jgi:hypothetical protein